ncbi:MAG: PAS domain S-box protein [bacterium]|nr:PAS domain S-box protein [bacterium]
MSHPKRLLAALILTIFLSEMAVMLLLSFFPQARWWNAAVADASLATLCALPWLYLFIIRPAMRESARRLTAQQQLRDERDRARLQLNISAAMVVELDLSENIRSINRKGCELLGYTEEELIGRNWYDTCIPQEHRDSLREHRARLTTGSAECVDDHEKPIIDRAGNLLLITFRCTVLRDDNGRVTGTLSSGVDITQHRLSEESLRLERERMANIIRSTNAGTWEWNLLTEEVVINERWAEILGYSKTELTSVSTDTWRKLCHPGDLVLCDENLTRHCDGKLDYYEVELRTKHKEGHWVWVLDRGQVTSWTPNGKPQLMQGTRQDIHQRKTAEERAKRTAHLDSILLKIYGESISLPDKEFCTHALDEAVKLTNSEIGFFHRISDDQKEIILTAWNGTALKMCTAAYDVHYPVEKAGNWVDCLRYGQPVVYNDFPHSPNQKGLPDGHASVKRFMSVPVFESGKCKLIFGVGNKSESYDELDVTHMQLLATELNKILRQRESEQIIQTSGERFRAISEHALTGIWIIQGGQIRYTNPILASQLGYTPAELLELQPLSLVHQDDLVTCSHYFGESVITESSLNQTALRLRNRQSDYLDYDLLVSPIDWDGQPATLCNLLNVTEVKRLKEQEARAQRLETIGRIAGQVAHDFNNLLGPIMAYPDLIKEELPEGNIARQYLSDIENAASRIAAINQDLLTLGRRGHYTVEPVNLNSIVTHALKEVAPRQEAVTCNLELADDLLCVKGGSAQLYRAVANLLHNALDAMDGRGELRLRTENYYAEEVTIAYQRVPRGEYVKLTIADTGCGIPDDALQRIFDPFFTTKKSDRKHGSGLGLSVVNSVLKDHCGYLDIRTETGRGTTFYIYLPASREIGRCEAATRPVGGSERILVVDDDSIQRAVLGSLLEKLGYQVTIAQCGEDAIKLLRENRFDLLVLDMIMPGGMDGADTYCRAASLYPGQKAIIVSGYSDSGRVNIAQEAGAGAFVKKPLTLLSIAGAVRGELDKHAPALTDRALVRQ